MLQFKVSPIYEDDSSDLEHDGNEEEADEGNQEEGSLPVNAKTGKHWEDNLCEAEAEHEKGKVQPASFLVKNAVIILK